ncbi:MAG: SpoIIE family protein phosphatase [Flammeovirgaceae bacterium]
MDIKMIMQFNILQIKIARPFFVGMVMLLLLVASSSQLLAQTEVYDYKGNKVTIEQLKQKAKEKEAAQDYRGASDYLNKAAMIEWEHNQYQKAIDLYEKSLELNSKIDNQQGITGITSNLAMIHADMKAYDAAYRYFKITLDARLKGTDKVSIISGHINISIVLNNLRRFNEAAAHLEEALDLAREMNDADQMKSCYGMLSETYEKAGRHEESLKYFNLYRTFHEMVQKDKEEVYRESAKEANLKAQLLEMENKNKQLALRIKNEELEKTQSELEEMEKLMSQFGDEKRELYAKATRADLLQQLLKDQETILEEEKRLRASEVAREQLIRNVLIVGLSVTAIFFIILYRKNQEKKRINNTLKERNEEVVTQQEHISDQNKKLGYAFEQLVAKNKKITQSINYAQKIQTAMLDYKANLSSWFTDSFILFQPKDIVSGDFYWYAEKDGLSVVAAVDCTGHGVPGAFMSMMGANLLKQIVLGDGITSPELILERLNEGVIESLNQEDTKNKDGMDMAIYTYDPKRKEVHFAGAKNPLIYIQNNELEIIKGSKRSIGWDARDFRTFEKHTIDVSTPTYLYTLSDGYQDQFGGEKDRKFMIKRLGQKLLEIHQEPMAKQHEVLKETFAAWKGNREQIDDVLIIGTKI